jgi:hypothetical protein
LRRLYKHLTRTTARSAWAIVLVCGVVFFAAPWRTTDEFALVLAGVAAGAIFLPDLTARLWQMSAADVRDTIPLHQREKLQRELISSQVELDGWTDYVWRQGLNPLMQAGSDSQAVRRDVSYRIDVRLRQDVAISRGSVVMNRVRTEFGSDRLLPSGVTRCFVSFARNSDALLAQYSDPACIGRELVSLPSIVGNESHETWQQEVLRTCEVLVGVDGAPVRLKDVECDGPVVRWLLPVSPDHLDRWVRVTVITEFLDEVESRSFPVIFGHYYCVDATHITFNLEKSGCATKLHAVEFFARGLGLPGRGAAALRRGRSRDRPIRVAAWQPAVARLGSASVLGCGADGR